MPLDLINNIHTILSAKILFGTIAYSDSNASKPDQKKKKKISSPSLSQGYCVRGHCRVE